MDGFQLQGHINWGLMTLLPIFAPFTMLLLLTLFNMVIIEPINKRKYCESHLMSSWLILSFGYCVLMFDFLLTTKLKLPVTVNIRLM